MSNFVTKSDYARLRGWSAPYISKLAKEGRLVLDAAGKKVNVAATNLLLKISADPSKAGVAEHWEKKRSTKIVNLYDTDDSPIDGEYDFQSARAKRETHLAKLAELEEGRKMGHLVETESVVKALTDYAIASRSALERLPDRISSVLAAESDPVAVFNILDDEIARICEEICSVAASLPQKLTQDQMK